MTPVPLTHTVLAGGVVHLTLTGADGQIASAAMSGKAAREFCWTVLSQVGPGENTWRAIADTVCGEHGVALAQIIGPSKEKHISRARQAVCWTLQQERHAYGARRWTNMAIARFIGIKAASVLKGARNHAIRNNLPTHT
jgi:hypothetical protein